jgi:hypothetical protein
MAFINLRAFTCQETQEAVDEPRLAAFVPDPMPTDPDHERFVPVSYPLRMDKGDTFEINQRIEFDDWIRIELWEQDSTGRNDRLGAVTVREADIGEHRTMLFRGPELAGAQSPLYSLTYDVAAEDTFEYPNRLNLVSLHCHDAQEATDEVYLTVNDHWIWEHGRMDNRQTEPVDEHEDFRDVVQVELWERDRNRSDWFGAMRLDLRRTEVERDRDLTHEFRFRRSSVDDARYTLTYRIEDAP